MDEQRDLTAAVGAMLRLQNRTRAELASALGVTVHTVNSKFKGQSKWSVAHLIGLGRFFGMSVSDLLHGERHAMDALIWKWDKEARERKAIAAATPATEPELTTHRG